jgi:multidrug efflux pump subunit AcrA (membrane-fusion protein)
MNGSQLHLQSIALLALAGTLLGCGLHGKPAVARKAPAALRAPITAGQPSSEDVAPDTVVSPGVVEPWGAQVDLAAQESGWIAQIPAQEGDVVQAGQLLATLEDGAERHAVELARGELAEAEAALAKLEWGSTVEEIQQAQADSDAAVARQGFASAVAARTARLYEEGLVADNEVDRTGADAKAQSAQAERAAARLRELENGARPEDKDAARAKVATAQARLRLAESNLARRRVVAPADGTILLSRFHSGEFYNAAAGPLFVLGDLSRLQVRMEVDEIDALAVAGGASCAVYSDAGVRLTTGEVVRLAPKMGRRGLPLESPTARADVRVREVFVEIPASANLVPGQRVWGHMARGGPTGERG